MFLDDLRKAITVRISCQHVIFCQPVRYQNENITLIKLDRIFFKLCRVSSRTEWIEKKFTTQGQNIALSPARTVVHWIWVTSVCNTQHPVLGINLSALHRHSLEVIMARQRGVQFSQDLSQMKRIGRLH